MKKNTAAKNGLMTVAIYLILFAVYNLLVFVIFSEKNSVFWVSYAFGCLAFIVQFVSMYSALHRQEMESVFMGIPLASLSFYYFFAAVFAAVVFMVFQVAPFKVALILQLLILAVYAVVALLATIGRNTVEDINDNVKEKSQALHTLNVDVDVLVPQAKDPALKKALRKLSETVKYSDPMSNDQVMDIEDQIMEAMNELRICVENEETENAIQTCKDVELLFMQRNKVLRATK